MKEFLCDACYILKKIVIDITSAFLKCIRKIMEGNKGNDNYFSHAIIGDGIILGVAFWLWGFFVLKKDDIFFAFMFSMLGFMFGSLTGFGNFLLIWLVYPKIKGKFIEWKEERKQLSVQDRLPEEIEKYLRETSQEAVKHKR